MAGGTGCADCGAALISPGAGAAAASVMAIPAGWPSPGWFRMPKPSPRRSRRFGRGPIRVPPRAQPAPRPDPVPPKAAPKPASDGLIVSTGLKPQLNVQFQPDRAVVTEQEVLLQFDVILTNSGSAPARDVLVDAKLVPAHAGQDQEIAAFFQQPQDGGDRMAGIPPLGKIALEERGPPADRPAAQLRGRGPQAVRAAGRLQHIVPLGRGGRSGFGQLPGRPRQ